MISFKNYKDFPICEQKTVTMKQVEDFEELKMRFFVLPSTILDLIFSYLSDEDILNVCSVNDSFATSASKHIRKRKFNLTNCYSMTDTRVLSAFNSRFLAHSCRRLNLNHCYWLTNTTIFAILQLTNLRQLHLIECDVTAREIDRVMHLKLTALSFSWSVIWKRFFHKNAIFVAQNIIKYLPCLRNLKELNIFVPWNWTYDELFNFLIDDILGYCRNLQVLDIFHFANIKQVESTFRPIYPLSMAQSSPVFKLKLLKMNMEINWQVRKCLSKFLNFVANGLNSDDKYAVPCDNYHNMTFVCIKENSNNEMLTQRLAKLRRSCPSSAANFKNLKEFQYLKYSLAGNGSSIISFDNYYFLQLKILNLKNKNKNRKFWLTKQLIDDICKCKYLEKITLKNFLISKENAQHLGKSLLTLDNLILLELIVSGETEFSFSDCLQVKELLKIKPKFCYFIANKINDKYENVIKSQWPIIFGNIELYILGFIWPNNCIFK